MSKQTKQAVTDNEIELLETLVDVIGQACYESGELADGTREYVLNSGFLTAYASGLRLLEEYGEVEILNESGRLVEARWTNDSHYSR